MKFQLSILLGAAIMFNSVVKMAEARQFERKSVGFVETRMGKIAYHINHANNSLPPILFFHGIYFDHKMWNYHRAQFTNRTTIAIDMPYHGQSCQEIPRCWDMEMVAGMVIDVLDELEIPIVHAVGHSWGSMSVLRAACSAPHRFASVGLMNMPVKPGDWKTRIRFRLQQTVLPFRKVFVRQAAKSLYGKETYAQNKQLFTELYRPISRIPTRYIKTVERNVIMYVDSGQSYLDQIRVPALALRGVDDYVPDAFPVSTIVVPGGHVTPLEKPDVAVDFIQRVLELTKGINPE